MDASGDPSSLKPNDDQGSGNVSTTSEVRNDNPGMTFTEALSQAHVEDRETPGGEVIAESELDFDEDGLVIIPDEHLKIAGRVLQLFARYPEAAVANRFAKFSPEYNLRQNIRINSMRWLKPGNLPSVKEIMKAKEVVAQNVLLSSGIRLNRNRQKRLLPNQIGQVIINEEDELPLLSMGYVVPDHIQKALDEAQSNAIQHKAAGTVANANQSESIADAKTGYNIPVKKTANFVPCQRKDLHENFRVHPSIDAAPLSSAKPVAASSEVEIEIVEESNEPATKKVKTQAFSRPVHPSNYGGHNPQPSAHGLSAEDHDVVMTRTASSVTVEDIDDESTLITNTTSAGSVVSMVTVSDSTVSEMSDAIASAQDQDLTVDISKSEFLSVSVPQGLQTQGETVRIAQRYARSFTGQNVQVTDNGSVVNPNASVSEATVDDDDVTTDTPTASDKPVSSSANKVVRDRKQEKQAWVSKEGMYGGSVKMGDEESITDALKSAADVADNVLCHDHSTEGRPRALKKSIPCYVCKTHFKVLHHFYDRMCPTCADFNYRKRFQSADMLIKRLDRNTGQRTSTQRICFLTGARVKIGYEIALKLLRAGAFVIATSRFAHDTALRFYREPDFDQWKDSLHIYGCDFRLISAVEMFCNHILKTYPRLDMIMNNAAQTIRRSPQFYRHLIENEAKPVEALPVAVHHLIKDFLPSELRKSASMHTAALLTDLGVSRSVLALEHVPTAPAAPTANSTSANVGVNVSDAVGDEETSAATEEPSLKPSHVAEEGEEVPAPAHALSVYNESVDRSTRLLTMMSLPQAAAINPAFLSQIPLVDGDEDKPEDAHLYPVGLYDKDDQQVDLREKQTWVLQSDEVSTVEMAEVQFVNSIAPFTINNKLKPLMQRSGDACWIINVTSMEGKFRGYKDTTHPHTNMAKAALNMLTHTSSKQFAHNRIFMNSVDTGWVTEELPHALAVHKAQLGFAPPLDEIDGAARCLDPVFTSLLTGVYEFGKFFKDYGECHW